MHVNHVMHQRSVYAVVLLLALVTSAAGNLLAAAFCPSAGRANAVCGQMAPQAEVSHSGMTHDMSGMEMGEMPISSERSGPVRLHSDDLFVAPDAFSNGLEQPFGDCVHCVSHSNVPTNALALRQSNTLPNSSHVAEPEPIVSVLTSLCY